MSTPAAAGRGTGLVLGGGGITGIAWEIGLLAGLAAAGVDLCGADTIVGTSAGSVVGAQITSGTPLPALYDTQLEPPTQAATASLGLRELLSFGGALLRSRGDLTGFGRRLGSLSLAAAATGRLPSLQERFEAITVRLPSLEWPAGDLRVTAVDARTGAFRTFTRDDGATLLEAVTASCAVPGVYPPVPIADRIYIDGGVRTGANADVARGCARIIALTPMSRTFWPIPSTRRQLDELGVPSVVITPDAGAVAAIGRNVLDPAARPGSARAGYEQAAHAVEEIRAVLP